MSCSKIKNELIEKEFICKKIVKYIGRKIKAKLKKHFRKCNVFKIRSTFSLVSDNLESRLFCSLNEVV